MLTTLIASALAMGSPADDAADFRCLAVSRRLAPVAAEKDRAAVRSTMFFYLGKLSATHGWMDISLTLSRTDVPAGDLLLAEAQRCAREIMDLGKQVGL